jgi:hypothetical protein
MKVIKWKCYCGNVEIEEREDGKDEITKETRYVELSCCPTGNYCKSPYWDKKADEEFARIVAEAERLKIAMKDVKPLKKKRGK